MTTTNNAPISFRLTNEEMELLKQYQEDGEKSVNLTAKRLLLSALGVDVKKSSLQLVNTVDISQIEELVDQAVQKKIAELIKVDSVDTAVKTQIADSLADGIIGDAIAKSYAAMMGNFNELLTQVQELKAAIPTAVASSPQSPDTSPQSPDTSPQSPVTSPHSPDTSPQSPIPNDQSPIERSHIENIRTTLKRKGISATTEQIRAAFFAAGWDGSNYQEIRKDIIEILSATTSSLITSQG